jgi:hypothetical protein
MGRFHSPTHLPFILLEIKQSKITLCRPTKSYPFWRGKVWWGVSIYGKKSGWVRFHIISDKKVQRLNLSEEQIRQMGKEKFVNDLSKKDLLFYDNNRKLP